MTVRRSSRRTNFIILYINIYYVAFRQIIENNEIKIIQSERGEDLILLDCNKYRFIGKRKDTRR